MQRMQKISKLFIFKIFFIFVICIKWSKKMSHIHIDKDAKNAKDIKVVYL